MKKGMSIFLKSTAVALTVALFPGCVILDFFKGKERKAEEAKPAGTGVVLCTIDDKPVITKDDFDKRINQILQANPYFRGASTDMLPPQVKQNVFKRLVEEELLIHDADAKNIENDAEFKQIYSEMKNLLKRSVKIQLTEKKIFDKIQISDEELKDNFEKNKDRYVKVAGGVLVSGIKFDTDAAASAFLTAAKAKVADFESMAKKNKTGQFKEFGRVGNGASAGMGMDIVPAPIKEAVLAMSNLPAVQKIKAGKDIWVIKASDKTAPVYFELNEIKDQIVGMLKNNKFRDEYNKVVKDLEGKYKVTRNDEFFNVPEAKPEGAASEEASGEAKEESAAAAPEEGASKEAEPSTAAA